MSFRAYVIDEKIVKALELLGYKEPTKVQKELIPVLLSGKDSIVKSRTGSGKTAAFAIPLCERIDWEENRPQALVLTPTRELAIQVKEEIFNVGRFKRLKVAALYGKSSYRHQVKEIKQKTHIVTGTPGRVIDHLENETLDVSAVRYLVIDEADEMLEMGFVEQIEEILTFLPDDRVTVVLSATFPAEIRELCHAYLKDPVSIEIQEDIKITEKIIQRYYLTDEEEKEDLLEEVIITENPDTCIIFCAMKRTVDEVYEFLKDQEYSCGRIHGGMEQEDRLSVMKQFKEGRVRYLVATDVAARGIDIEDVSLVVNFDMPRDKEGYIHRIGRTGRVEKTGKAISFVTKSDARMLKQIEAYIDTTLEPINRIPKEQLDASRKTMEESIKDQPVKKKDKNIKLNQDIMKIHINAGKKTKMRAVDIVGTLCNIDGMTADDIGVINILDVSTFVEILNGKGPMVLLALQKKPIKGRIRKVKDETLGGDRL